MQKKTLGSLRRVALTTLVLCLLAMAAASTATAAPGHVLAGSVSTSVTGGLAVNTTSGNTYVADSTGVSEVSTGTAVPFVAGVSFGGLAVNSTTGTVYAIDTSIFPTGVNTYASDGTPGTPLDGSSLPFFNPTAVAVDPSTGLVYVASTDPNFSLPTVIDVFKADGSFDHEIAGPPEMPFFSPTAMSIDGSGNLYVLDSGAVNKYGVDGTFQSVFVSSASAVAADPASDDVYTVENNPTSSVPEIVNYDSAGAVLFRFGANQISSGVTGMGVNADARVYVADPNAQAVLFYDAVLAPNVTTGAATVTSATTADLGGTVDPLGQSTTYQFEWGTSSSYGNLTDPVDAGDGTGDVPAIASLTGLLPSQEYHFRLTASGASTPGPVTNVGDDATFITDSLPPVVATGAAESVKRTTARVNGTVNPNNKSTAYSFEYGTTTAYGSKAGGTVPAGDAADHPVDVTLTGLAGGTTYHYRLVADNGTGGVQEGVDQTFTTLDPLAVMTIGLPTDVTKTSATLHGTVDTQGFPMTYSFTVRGTDNPFVGASPTVQLPAAAGPQVVTASIDGLPSGGGFEVRMVATSGGGNSVSDPVGFRTESAGFVSPPPPLVDLAPYGCGAPRLNAYNAKARPGRTITLTGSDLGVGGVVTFGSSMADTDSWGANAIRVVVPDDARGSAAVKVDCARESNTIRVAIAKATAKKKKAKAKSCKRGYVKKKVKGKTRCVKKKAAPKGRRG